MSEAYPITVCDRCGKRLYPTLGRDLQPVYLEGMGSPAVVHKHPEGYRAVTQQLTVVTTPIATFTGVGISQKDLEYIADPLKNFKPTKKPIKSRKRKSAR